MSTEALKNAINIVGGQTALGKVLGVRQSNVGTWLHKAKKVPAEYCPEIERATDGVVRCEDLRPDINWSVLRTNSAA